MNEKISNSQPLFFSVLDRLLDDAVETERVNIESIKRDLENLLNTKRRCLSWPTHLQQLNKSIINYGIDDFMGLDLDSMTAKERLCQHLEESIKLFESRFKSVRVTLAQNETVYGRSIRFKIEALIYLEPEYEAIVFDSVFEENTRQIKIVNSDSHY
jgi:type VI secretion system protein ImpF